MACRLFGELMLTLWQLKPHEQTQVIFELKYKYFFENAFEKIIYKLSVILCRPRFLKRLFIYQQLRIFPLSAWLQLRVHNSYSVVGDSYFSMK